MSLEHAPGAKPLVYRPLRPIHKRGFAPGACPWSILREQNPSSVSAFLLFWETALFYNDWFAVDIMAGFFASSQSNAVVKYFTRGECEGVCPEANLVTIPWSFRKTVLNKIKSKKIPPKSEIKNSGRNKPRGENANAGIIVCKGHAETLKAVICHLNQSKCAMLDLSKEGCGQIWSLVVTRTSNDVFQQNLHVWIG